jgi:dihydrofolate reductase
MKKVICRMSVSLDGYIEGPNREIDWHVLDEELNAYVVEMLEASDVLILGRKTYELMAGYWPTAEGDDSSVRSFKDLMNGKPKLVFSRTLKKVEWQNSRLAIRTLSEEVTRLKQTPGDGLICVGGSDLAASFLEEGLLDELWVLVTPVLIGGGKTLVDGIKKRHPLTLLSTRAFKSGNVALTYEVVRR